MSELERIGRFRNRGALIRGIRVGILQMRADLEKLENGGTSVEELEWLASIDEECQYIREDLAKVGDRAGELLTRKDPDADEMPEIPRIGTI